jgi:hypothetical protein
MAGKWADITGHMSLNDRKMNRYKRHTRKNGGDRETNKSREIYKIDQATPNNI